MQSPDLLDRLNRGLAGRYRVDRELGAGGMATVWLAQDLRHEREVAIKVLHPDLGAAIGGDRFLSEIKTTAKLQHPHILPLLDSGEADGLLFYVMPFVRGETMRARLERSRPLAIAEALRIAREVASALDYAHRQGVVHRDIKPENILLHEGQALVADFGIALAVQTAGGQRMTQTGLSLGTPQYMAPEQAMGERSLDARADIYALGAVTYEMLSGEPPFTGSSVQAIIARVLSERPTPLRTLRDTVPPMVEEAISTSLAKLPADRFETAKAFAEALQQAATVSGATLSAGDASRAGHRRGLGWPIAAGVAVAALAVGAVIGRGWTANSQGESRRPAPTQFTIEMRPGERLPFFNLIPFSLSPDGSALSYTVVAFGSPLRTMLRDLSQLDPKPLDGLEASRVVFSPDGQWLAYTRGRRVFKRRAAGGDDVPVTADGAPGGNLLAWLSDDRIVWAADSGRAIVAVNAAGGEPTTAVQLPDTVSVRILVAVSGRPEVLFNFSVRDDRQRNGVGWASLATGEWRPLNVPGAEMPLGVLADALLYATRDGELMAAPWDADNGDVTGIAVRVMGGISVGGPGLVYATLSPSGDLAYLDQSSRSQLMMVRPGGAVEPVVPDTLDYRMPRLSPDGRLLAVSVFEGSPTRHNIYTVDLRQRTLSRLDDNDDIPWRDRPEWGPDSRMLYYRTVKDGVADMARRPADRSGSEERTTLQPVSSNEIVVLSDGKTLVGRVNGPRPGASAGQNLATWTWGDSTPRFLLDGRGSPAAPRVSPDGQWLVFSRSTAESSEHVFVTPFPGPGPQVQVDLAGAAAAVWGRDGRTIYYPDVDGIVAATLSLGANPAVVSRRRALGLPLPLTTVHAAFDVGPDGTLYIVKPLREERLILVRDLDIAVRAALSAR